VNNNRKDNHNGFNGMTTTYHSTKPTIASFHLSPKRWSFINITLFLRFYIIYYPKFDTADDGKRPLSLCVYNFTLFGVLAKLRGATMCFVTFIPPSARSNSAPTGWIFMKFDSWGFFRKSVDKVQVLLKSDKNSGYFRPTWRPFHVYDRKYLAEFFL